MVVVQHDVRHPRDFAGYGAQPPDPQWPGGARLATQIVMNYTLDSNDMTFSAAPGFTCGEGFFRHLKDAFDVLYRSLVAPVTLGDGAMTGAWPVVIRDDPAGDRKVDDPARSIAKKPAGT
jgi:hypothetical protein